MRRWSSASPRRAGAGAGPWSGWLRPPRPRPPHRPHPGKVCGQAGGAGGAHSPDLSQHPLLVPPDLGPQTSTSPGRLVRSLQLLPALHPSPDSARPSPPPLHTLCLSPSRCPFKALSGRKFDYRVFAALPSSRPVYDMQVPGPSAGQPRTAPAAFPPAPASQACPSHSACLESCSVGAGPPQPAPILGPGLRGDPHPGSGGWLQAGLGCRPDLTLLPIAVPRFC